MDESHSAKLISKVSPKDVQLCDKQSKSFDDIRKKPHYLVFAGVRVVSLFGFLLTACYFNKSFLSHCHGPKNKHCLLSIPG